MNAYITILVIRAGMICSPRQSDRYVLQVRLCIGAIDEPQERSQSDGPEPESLRGSHGISRTAKVRDWVRIDSKYSSCSRRKVDGH